MCEVLSLKLGEVVVNFCYALSLLKYCTIVMQNYGPFILYILRVGLKNNWQLFVSLV